MQHYTHLNFNEFVLYFLAFRNVFKINIKSKKKQFLLFNK